MGTWTNKTWGALSGAILVVLAAWLGLGVAALVVVFGVVGYLVGKLLDGELDIEDIRGRRGM